MVAYIKSLSGNKGAESLGLGHFWTALLFALTLVLSMFYYLPASWLVSQPMVQQEIPKQMLIDSVSGSVWDGEMRVTTHIANKSGVIVDLGTLQWDIDWLSLLKANLSSQQQWILAENSQMGFYFERDFLSAESPLLLTGLKGSFDIAQLVRSLASAGLPTVAASGQIIANDVEIALDQSTFWPEEVSGQFEIHSLSTFGINLPVVTVVSSMEAQVVQLDLSAEEDAWQLQGRIIIAPTHTYNVSISVKADSAKQMPDWAQMMVQKTPTLATFANQGRW